MRKRMLSLMALLALNVLAVYAPVAVCLLLFRANLRKVAAAEFLFFPVWFAEIVFWLIGFSPGGRALPEWVILLGFLLTVLLASVLFAGVKKARFWMPFLLFWACLFQDALALLERFRSWYSGRHQPDASARGREEEPSLTRRVDARRHINLESALVLSTSRDDANLRRRVGPTRKVHAGNGHLAGRFYESALVNLPCVAARRGAARRATSRRAPS